MVFKSIEAALRISASLAVIVQSILVFFYLKGRSGCIADQLLILDLICFSFLFFQATRRQADGQGCIEGRR